MAKTTELHISLDKTVSFSLMSWLCKFLADNFDKVSPEMLRALASDYERIANAGTKN